MNGINFINTFKKKMKSIEKCRKIFLKIIILLETILLYSSILIRLILSKKFNQLHMTVDFYSLCLVSFAFMSEFMTCCLCKSIETNFVLIKNYSGKGIIYILLSIFYMAPEFSRRSNPKYILLCAGILCIIGDLRNDEEKEKKKCLNKHNDFENPIPKETGNDGKIQITENSSDLELKKSCNPYEYPDDF